MVGGSVPNAKGECPHVAQGMYPCCTGSVPNGEGSVPSEKYGQKWGCGVGFVKLKFWIDFGWGFW